VDLEVVAGWPDIDSVRNVFLTNYFLRLYASPQYLESRGMPASLDDVKHHSFVSYVESALQVAEIGPRSMNLPEMNTSFQATSIFAQTEAVRRGAGIGLLANFMVNGRPGFVPVLPQEFQRQLPMWAAARPESLRAPVVEAVVRSIQREVAERQSVLAD
jgi:DNA-binding transcriptional LysR family regulator